ncbi:T-complex protein 1 subunit theta-like [Paramacrobiotus metropolitanus]|uniref:T-complex protein 1 subunit theta-like n=1 Tax=Paramacrobiotus metropolitanus TaxID=2943436 RepID=UPI0024460A8B|nr:T-complex protein 1 subunit theta-like [Paramacrobiotus metropolitanus]
MAMHVPSAPGFAQMLTEGTRFYSGVDETVQRSIEACRLLTRIISTSYGPKGLNKMVVTHLGKMFITNDAATIVKELENEHPGVKLVIMASEMQEKEIGDATNFTLIFAGALLDQAEELLRMGISVADITDGYELALKKALELLETIVCGTVTDFRDQNQISRAIKASITSKQYGNEDFLTKLISTACISLMPEKGKSFNVDRVRTIKLLGSGLLSSSVMNGMVFKRETEGDINKAENAKVVVYACAVDINQTETKGTVLIKTANELLNYTKDEEDLLEKQIKAIADTGAKVVVSGGKVGDLALHFLNKYKLMAVRLTSKFDIRRVANSVGAIALTNLIPPTADDMGHCDKVYLDEIGDTSVVVFQQEKKEGSISTIILRGATDNSMDDVERAIDDGVNNFKVLTKDERLLPGAGATEVELSRLLTQFADTRSGLEQYAVKKFAQALEVFPKILAENAGVKAMEILAKLHAAHQEGLKNVGFNIEEDGEAIIDAEKAGIFDLFLTKSSAMRLAVGATNTLLKVNKIVMAKPAGGPKPPKTGPQDADDE